MTDNKIPEIPIPDPARRGGRPPGAPNKVTVATRERIENEADPIAFLGTVMRGEAIKSAPAKEEGTQIAIFPTTDQRISAARVLADKLVPNAKARPITMEVPKFETAGDLVAALGSVIETMACGEITPDEAAIIAGVIEHKRRAIETVEIMARLDVLEAKQRAER